MAATSPVPVPDPGPEPARAPVAAFSHVQLQVRDVPTSERWYTTVFGMDRLAADPQGTYVALRHPPSRVVIVLSQRGDVAGDDSALDHLAFGVRDEAELREWADHLTVARDRAPRVSRRSSTTSRCSCATPTASASSSSPATRLHEPLTFPRATADTAERHSAHGHRRRARRSIERRPVPA